MHIIKICTGCSCEKNSGIKVGKTTNDRKFRLEKTGCLSNCEKGPNVMINDTVESHMLPHRLEKRLKELQ